MPAPYSVRTRLYEARYVFAAAAAFIALYVFLDVNKLHALRFGADVGVFLQALLNFARSGSTFDWAEARPHLAIHDSWLLLAFSPLVAAFPRPETLIVLQVSAVALAAVPLFFFSRSFGLDVGSSTCIALAYLVSPSAQGWAYGNFIENYFVPLLAFSLALAVRKRSLWGTLLCSQMLMGLKEDEIWFLLWLGLVGALWYDRRLGVAVGALAAVNAGAYYGIVHALGYAPNDPGYGFYDRAIPQQAAFFLEILAPFAFAPLLLGARIAIALPFVAELTLNAPWHTPLARTGLHYTTPIVSLIAIGAVVAIAKRPILARYALLCSVVMALFFNVTVLHFGRHLFVPDELGYARARAVAASDEAVTYLPDDEGAYAIASSDLNARYVQGVMLRAKPAWNTSGTPLSDVLDIVGGVGAIALCGLVIRGRRDNAYARSPR